jgi:hypothetical protein
MEDAASWVCRRRVRVLHTGMYAITLQSVAWPFPGLFLLPHNYDTMSYNLGRRGSLQLTTSVLFRHEQEANLSQRPDRLARPMSHAVTAPAWACPINDLTALRCLLRDFCPRSAPIFQGFSQKPPVRHADAATAGSAPFRLASPPRHIGTRARSGLYHDSGSTANERRHVFRQDRRFACWSSAGRRTRPL